MGTASPSTATRSFPVDSLDGCRTVLGCRALVLLHDEDGHPLLATTHRGDQQLMVGLPSLIARYEQGEGPVQVKRIIVDREGMATESPFQLACAGASSGNDLANQSVPGSDLVLAGGDLCSIEHRCAGTHRARS